MFISTSIIEKLEQQKRAFEATENEFKLERGYGRLHTTNTYLIIWCSRKYVSNENILEDKLNKLAELENNNKHLRLEIQEMSGKSLIN